jgi:hypothetical protein
MNDTFATHDKDAACWQPIGRYIGFRGQQHGAFDTILGQCSGVLWVTFPVGLRIGTGATCLVGAPSRADAIIGYLAADSKLQGE